MVNLRLRRLVAQVCEGTDAKDYKGSMPSMNASTAWKGASAIGPDGKPIDPGAPSTDGKRIDGVRWSMPPVDKEKVETNLDSILARYDQERDKRKEGSTKVGGVYQYPRIAELAKHPDPKIAAKFAAILRDPYVDVPERPPINDEVQVTIIGAGYGGLVAAGRMREAGIDNNQIRILDRGGDVGGTWYWNRYPGAMCDIEAPIYLPLCEEIGYKPTERYASQPEIYKHSKMIATHFGLYEQAIFGTEITELRWDEGKKMWQVSTDRNDKFFTSFLIANFGVFTHPKLPASPGVELFEGHMWHTSRWDYGYTGGSSAGGLVNLQDKKVGIIGTGATAIQAIPHLGAWSKELYVFQRTPSAVDVRNNHVLDEKWKSRFMGGPGWQKDRIDTFTRLMEGNADTVQNTADTIQDGWTSSVNLEQDKLRDKSDMNSKDRKRLLSEVEHMERIRDRIPTIVKDPQTAEVLKPWYSLWCKRPTFHDEYLPTFNRPSVHLIDVSTGGGVQAFTRKGVVANGIEYELDCICLATGFELSFTIAFANHQGDRDHMKRKTAANGYEVIGRGGKLLSEYWQDGPRTLNSYNVRGFPNMWIMNGPQGVGSASFVTPLEALGRHAAHMIVEMGKRGWKTVECKEQAEAEYCDMIMNSANLSSGNQGQAFYQNCTPGYYNLEGNSTVGKSLSGGYKGGKRGATIEFFDNLVAQRANGTAFEQYDVA